MGATKKQNQTKSTKTQNHKITKSIDQFFFLISQNWSIFFRFQQSHKKSTKLQNHKIAKLQNQKIKKKIFF